MKTLKFFIAIAIICTLSLSKGTVQNTLTDLDGTAIDMVVVKNSMIKKDADTIINNMFNSKKFVIRRQLIRAWGKQYVLDLEDSVYTGKDTNIVKFYNLLYSNSTEKKFEIITHLGHEFDGLVTNYIDSLAMGISFTGHIHVGILRERNIAKNTAYLESKDGECVWKVKYISVAKCSATNGRSYIYRMFY